MAHSPYGSLERAIASLSLFTHPDTVRQAGARALFRIIRARGGDRGKIVHHTDGNRVLLDDNAGPTDAFLWHANPCLLPAFLAKLSDTHPRITMLLRWRAESMYGWRPGGEPPSREPDGADALDWAEPLPAVESLESALPDAMRTKPKNRTSISAREIG